MSIYLFFIKMAILIKRKSLNDIHNKIIDGTNFVFRKFSYSIKILREASI